MLLHGLAADRWASSRVLRYFDSPGRPTQGAARAAALVGGVVALGRVLTRGGAGAGASGGHELWDSRLDGRCRVVEGAVFGRPHWDVVHRGHLVAHFGVHNGVSPWRCLDPALVLSPARRSVPISSSLQPMAEPAGTDRLGKVLSSPAGQRRFPNECS